MLNGWVEFEFKLFDKLILKSSDLKRVIKRGKSRRGRRKYKSREKKIIREEGGGGMEG